MKRSYIENMVITDKSVLRSDMKKLYMLCRGDSDIGRQVQDVFYRYTSDKNNINDSNLSHYYQAHNRLTGMIHSDTFMDGTNTAPQLEQDAESFAREISVIYDFNPELICELRVHVI